MHVSKLNFTYDRRAPKTYIRMETDLKYMEDERRSILLFFENKFFFLFFIKLENSF